MVANLEVVLRHHANSGVKPRFMFSGGTIFLSNILLTEYATEVILAPMWEVEYTDEFEAWWSSLTEDEQVSVSASVQLLEARGPSLGFPHIWSN